MPDDYLNQNAKNYAEQQINNIISEEFYGDTYAISENVENEITYIQMSANDISSMKINLSKKINEQINGNSLNFIPIGSLLNYSLLNGYGFNIPINMNYIGSASVDIKTELVSAGINQSVYNLTVCIYAEVSTFCVNASGEAYFYSEYPICNVYIAGDVPNYKYNY
ncbi:MAG: sporulation protein YunB [Clostridia bacterium]